jgi:hypothetical protein
LPIPIFFLPEAWMPFSPIRAWVSSRTVWERWAILLWVILIGATCIRGFIKPNTNNCYQRYYANAGLHWYHGEDLYQQTADTCRYSPLVHVFLIPYNFLPDRWGALLWRLTNSVVFLGGMYWWIAAILPGTLRRNQRA